jgi:hypothetical protein
MRGCTDWIDLAQDRDKWLFTITLPTQYSIDDTVIN